jgi:hypothetical protein
MSVEYVFALYKDALLVKIFFDIERALLVAQAEGLSVLRHRIHLDGSCTTMCIFGSRPEIK